MARPLGPEFEGQPSAIRSIRARNFRGARFGVGSRPYFWCFDFLISNVPELPGTCPNSQESERAPRQVGG